MPGIDQHRFGVLFGTGDLGGIFVAQRFGFGAQLLGFVELLLDRGNLAVEPAGNGLVNLGPEERDQQEDEHRQRDDLERRQAPQFGFGMRSGTAVAVLDEDLGRFGGEDFGRGVSHGSGPP